MVVNLSLGLRGGGDAKVEFTSPNGTTTTAKTEWEVVVCPSKDIEYPERAGFQVAR